MALRGTTTSALCKDRKDHLDLQDPQGTPAGSVLMETPLT